MKRLIHLIGLAAILSATLVLPACSTSGVQDARQSGLENRQNRMDSRVSARQERWKVRGEREDARAEARMNSW